MIAFVGSVFSPYYYWAGRRRPENHVAVNVALYGDGWSRWAMTERRARTLRRTPSSFFVGASGLRWDGAGLTVELDETSVPHLGRLRGRLRLEPSAVAPEAYALDTAARHGWRTVAPAARLEVAFDRPRVGWSGAGYFDMNWGAEPIERGFRRWDWSRAVLPDGGAAVLYDADRRDGSRLDLALRFDGKGGVERVTPPSPVRLPRGFWGVEGRVQADPGAPPRIVRRYEDAPFYRRSELAMRLFGTQVRAMHESLDLDAFDTTRVKLMLPWRMPRTLR